MKDVVNIRFKEDYTGNEEGKRVAYAEGEEVMYPAGRGRKMAHFYGLAELSRDTYAIPEDEYYANVYNTVDAEEPAEEPEPDNDEAADDEEDDEEDIVYEELDYADMKYNELKSLAAEHGLDTSGKKDDLVERLEENA